MISELATALFSDNVVTPTELARHVSEITRGALRRPVTIHRPEGDLALMDRQMASGLVEAARASQTLAGFSRNLLWILRGRGCPSPEWEWLQSFSPDDVADFLEEYISATLDALAGRAEWSQVAAVLHEWRESARAQEDQPFLAEVVTWRGVVTGEEATRLSAAELRQRLDSAVRDAGDAR